MKAAATRRKRALRALVASLGLLVLTACGTASTATPPPLATSSAAPADMTREDNQGAVTVKVTPLNLDNRAATLDFDVALDTHSVDLSMDLTQLAVLRTNTGTEVQATGWPVGSGHHYQATLFFPTETAQGGSLLEGATRLSLILKNVGVPERVFEWGLSK